MFICLVINFKVGVRPEALTNAMRLYCAVTSIPDHVEIVWYYGDNLLKMDGEKYRVLYRILISQFHNVRYKYPNIQI